MGQLRLGSRRVFREEAEDTVLITQSQFWEYGGGIWVAPGDCTDQSSAKVRIPS